MTDLATIEGEAAKRLTHAATLEELQAAQAEILGKRSPLNDIKKTLGGLAPEERKAVGQQLNEARARLEEAFAARQAELSRAELGARLAQERLDLTEITSRSERGHLNLISQTRNRLEDTFVAMGFTVVEGPVVETDWHNFEALNMIN